ncbi:MAG: phosphotransferase [Betaproteobacteria bacterium]|nr:phosphotransferase [Betaproteobacteria bacterium]
MRGRTLAGDGRLSALNSFENRVYQAHLDSPFEGHSQVVAKFYRPGRWSDAQIAEEHAFAADLVAAEVPAVPPLVVNGQTLHHFDGFAFAVSPRRGGRRPELDDFDVLEWIGRFLGRLHTVGAAASRAAQRAAPGARCLRTGRTGRKDLPTGTGSDAPLGRHRPRSAPAARSDATLRHWPRSVGTVARCRRRCWAGHLCAPSPRGSGPGVRKATPGRQPGTRRPPCRNAGDGSVPAPGCSSPPSIHPSASAAWACPRGLRSR